MRKNRVRADMQLHPVIYPIEKNEQVIKHLKKQGMTLLSVPEKDVHVELFFRVALSTWRGC